MKNKKLVLALVLPLLTSGLLISCKPKNTNNSETLSSQSAVQTTENLPQNNQNLEELQKTLTEAENRLKNVDTYLKSVNDNLQKFVTTTDQEDKDNIRKNINFKPTTESWYKFKQIWVILKGQLDNESRVKSSLNKGVNLEANENDFITELEQKITELDAIIQLFNESIIKEDKAIIEKLQKQLEMTPTTYGDFGKITQGELQTKTTDKITAIKDDINTVKEKINNLLNSSDVSDLKDQIEQLNNNLADKKKENDKLTQEKQTLENEKQVLTQQINDANKKFIFTLAGLFGLGTLNISMIVFFIIHNKNRKTKKNNKQSNKSETLNYPSEQNTLLKSVNNTIKSEQNNIKLKKILDELKSKGCSLLSNINSRGKHVNATDKSENHNFSDEQNTVLKSENNIKQWEQERNKLYSELDQLKQTNKELQGINSQLSQENWYFKNQNTSNSGSQPNTSHINSSSSSNLTHHSTSSALATKTPTITNKEELVSIYNANSLFNYNNTLIAVSTEPTSIETSRTGSGKRPVLTEQSPSKYWIVEIGRDLYLVPKENALNTNDMTSVEVLFECWGYKKDISNPKAFTLIEPGKVKEINGQWELVECGILDYR